MTKLATVSQVFNTSSVTGAFGVEIEVEGSSLPISGFTNWRVEADGSLRGESAEYVLAAPMDYDYVVKALAELRSRFTKSETQVSDSIRAGIHIHINVNDLTIPQLLSFLTCYYLVESLITRKAGKNRSGNLFALRLEDAYGTIPYLINFLQSGDTAYLGNNNSIRYAACNLSSLGKYGSVEFRQLGTSKDFDKKILTWCQLLGSLKENSLKFSSPREIIYALSGEGANTFVNSILDTSLANEFIFSEPDYSEKIMEYSRYVQDYVFCISDDKLSSVFSEANIRPPKKKRDLGDPQLRSMFGDSLSSGTIRRPTNPVQWVIRDEPVENLNDEETDDDN